MEKAYDQVEWEFLFWELRIKGFEERWIRWMEGFVVGPHFLILVNETSK